MCKSILKEVYFVLRLNRRWLPLLCIMFIAFFSIQIFSNTFLSMNKLSQLHDVELSEESHYYILRDNFVGSSESALFNNSESLALLDSFYAALKAIPYSDYYVVKAQPLLFKDFPLDDQFIYEYDKGNSQENKNIPYTLPNGESFLGTYAQCIWLDTTAYELYEIQISKGSGWTAESHMYNDERVVPLLVGSNIEQAIPIGTKISLEDYVGNVSGIVVGVLAPGQLIEDSGRLINLDNYFLHPIYETDYAFETEEQFFYQMVSMLMKINGTFKTLLPANELQASISDICIDLSISPAPSLEGATNRLFALTAVKLHSLARSMQLLSSVVSLVLLITTLVVAYFFLRKKRKYFQSLLICGFSSLDIASILVIPLTSILFFCLSCSIILASILAYFYGQTINPLPSILYLIVLIISSVLLGYYTLSNGRYILKGDSDA